MRNVNGEEFTLETLSNGVDGPGTSFCNISIAKCMIAVTLVRQHSGFKHMFINENFILIRILIMFIRTGPNGNESTLV